MGNRKKLIASISRGRKRGEDAEFPVTPLRSAMPSSYAGLIEGLKKRIQQSRLRAASSVNQELLLLYYSMGHDLDHRLQEEEWGSGVIERISADLRASFPGMGGVVSAQFAAHARLLSRIPAICGKTATLRGRIAAANLATGRGQIALDSQCHFDGEDQRLEIARLVCGRRS